MPNIKSAKKRVKVAAAKTAANKIVKSALKTSLKKAEAAVEANAADKDQAVRVALQRVFSKIIQLQERSLHWLANSTLPHNAEEMIRYLKAGRCVLLFVF